MTDTVANEETVVETQALEDIKSSESAESDETASVEALEEAPKPRKRGRKPKAEKAEETKVEESKTEVKEDEVEETKSAETKDEPEPEKLEEVTEVAEVAEVVEVVDVQAKLEESCEAFETETAEGLPQQIVLTSRTPLYRGPSKSARIAGASGVAVVLGKVGEFTKISYVRRGVGVQEGYVILDA